jgi:hypothetical protein
MCILRELAVNADRASWKPFAAPQDQFPQSHPFNRGFFAVFFACRIGTACLIPREFGGFSPKKNRASPHNPLRPARAFPLISHEFPRTSPISF